MAAQVQPSPTNPPLPPTNGQPPSTTTTTSSSSSSNPPQLPPLSWEGDRMFNVYIHDYFLKRGFRKAAKELVIEAEIGNDASPPINARQGFLFEWWSVFWMFFSAKTTGNGPDNVLLYFHWIQNHAERTRLQHENDQRRVSLPLTAQPPPRAMTRPPPNGIRPPGMVNGAVPIPQAPGQPAPPSQAIQYPMGVPHGSIPTSHQQPPPGPGQAQPQINGIDPSTPHGHPMSNPQRPPSQQQQNRPGPHGSIQQQSQGHLPPSHPNAVPHLQPSQRQVPRGQHEAIRPPGQFHSPPMATAHPPGPGQQGPLGHPHIHGMGGPMPQLGALGAPGATQHLPQHQHIGRGPPPQAGQPNSASPRNPSQTPTQPYQQLMNPSGTLGPLQSTGSRSGTPGGNPLTQQSPALAAREPPSQGPQSVNEEMSRRFQQQQQQHQLQQQRHHHQQQQQQQDQQQRNNPHDQPDLAAMETNLGRIPKVFLHPMMQEAGCHDGREVENLSFEEKTRLNEVFKRTMNVYTGNTSNAPRNGSVPRSGMNQPPMSGMPMGPPQGPSRQPSTAQRGQKRASTSPSDEQGGDSTPKDQSPPERKRQRHSPPGAIPGGTDTGVAPPPMGSMGGFPPNHPGSRPGGYPGPVTPQHPQSMPSGFRGGQMGGPMNPHPGQQQPVPNVGGMSMAGMVPGMGHQMPPGMAPNMTHMTPALTNQHIHQMPNSQVAATGRPPLPSPEISYPFQNQSQQSQQMQQQQMHYRQTMANQHLHKMPSNLPSAPNPINSNPSPSADPHDNSRSVTAGGGTGVGNRPQQQGKPGSMMPPPSPAHRAENTNAQKGTGMMPPPAQPVNGPGNSGGTSKEQTAPSPAGGRHEGGTGSSPSIRPESRSGAGGSANTSVPTGAPSMSQGGGPATPASAGGNNGGNTAPSPSAILSNRISPSAAMNSLPRPQTSGPDGTAVVSGAAGNVVQSQQPPPPSAPSSGTGSALPSTLFGDFFDSMEDNFGLDSLESIDPAEFSQWIDMNPLS